MKKSILIILFVFLSLPVFSQAVDVDVDVDADSKPIECEVAFDWISKTQIQRDENIAQIQSILFNEKTVLKYPKNEFKAKFAEFSKDKDAMQNYIEIRDGKKEDETRYYAAFYSAGGLFLAYGIQYKNNMKNIYYYDVLGHLRFVDFYSSQYPKFPYYALQYNTSGRLIGTIYFVLDYDQYIFNPNKSFKGRWYKDKMYNKNAKVIMTRSTY